MPRDGAIIFSDLIGKLDVLRVTCAKSERAGRYRLQRLIEERGRDAKIVDWLGKITADCPKKVARNWSDQCAARCPDLAAVLQHTGGPRCPLMTQSGHWPDRPLRCGPFLTRRSVVKC